MDHLPAAETHAHVCDPSVAILFRKEEQVTHFEWRFNRFRRGMLHIGIARDVHADPAVKQAREA
jgi:hypothetical protein